MLINVSNKLTTLERNKEPGLVSKRTIWFKAFRKDY
jgi:hypothetical protein